MLDCNLCIATSCERWKFGNGTMGFSSVELVRVVNHERLFRGLSQRIQFAIASKKNTNGFDTTHIGLYILLL